MSNTLHIVCILSAIGDTSPYAEPLVSVALSACKVSAWCELKVSSSTDTICAQLACQKLSMYGSWVDFVRARRLTTLIASILSLCGAEGARAPRILTMSTSRLSTAVAPGVRVVERAGTGGGVRFTTLSEGCCARVGEGAVGIATGACLEGLPLRTRGLFSPPTRFSSAGGLATEEELSFETLVPGILAPGPDVLDFG